MGMGSWRGRERRGILVGVERGEGERNERCNNRVEFEMVAGCICCW